jgi:hypothetical protein
MRQIRITAIILVAALAAQANAQDQCQTPSPDGQATINGKVTAESGGAAVFSSIVALGEGPGFSTLVGSGITMLDGTYSVQVPAPATYVVAALPVDQVHAPEFWDGELTRTAAAKISVTDGEVVNDVDFTVLTGATMSGTVTAANGGAAIQGVGVQALVVGDLPSAAATQTNGSGEYTLTGLAETTYQVRFAPDDTPDNYLIELYNNKPGIPGDPVNVSLPGVTGIDAALEQGGRIEGQVTGPNNQPVASLQVQALPAGGAYEFGNTSTDAGGNYSLVVAAGAYNVLVSANTGLSSELYDGKFTVATADDVNVTAGNTTSGIDVQLDQSGKITGHVTDALNGDPIAFAVVSATEDGGITGASGAVAFTDAQGAYQLNTNLHTGEYKIGFFAAGFEPAFYSDKTSPLNADPVSVTAPGTTPNIDQVLILCGDEGPTTTLGSTTTSVPATTTTTTVTSTSLPGTTTTTLAGGGTCGDPVALIASVGDDSMSTDGGVLPRAISASDALFVLRTAVGSATCELCVCDVNNSGTVTASDALTVLRSAVGQSVELTCPAC